MDPKFEKLRKALGETPSLLFFDIETRPIKVWAWRTGKQYITHEQIAEESKIISIQWMFEGDKTVSFLTWDRKQNDKEMLTRFSEKASVAKVLVSQNGKSFDHKVMNWRLNVHKLPPLSKATIFDTLSLSRQSFFMASHKLDYRSKVYGLGGKVKMHLSDWVDVVEGKAGALEKMVEYGCKDILDLQEIFWREIGHYTKIPAGLNLLLYPPEPRRECPWCAKARRSKFKIIPVQRAMKTFWKCENCGNFWEAKNVK